MLRLPEENAVQQPGIRHCPRKRPDMIERTGQRHDTVADANTEADTDARDDPIAITQPDSRTLVVALGRAKPLAVAGRPGRHPTACPGCRT